MRPIMGVVSRFLTTRDGCKLLTRAGGWGGPQTLECRLANSWEMLVTLVYPSTCACPGVSEEANLSRRRRPDYPAAPTSHSEDRNTA